jgi:hypothetical protein
MQKRWGFLYRTDIFVVLFVLSSDSMIVLWYSHNLVKNYPIDSLIQGQTHGGGGVRVGPGTP